jgi:hypothetical protein
MVSWMSAAFGLLFASISFSCRFESPSTLAAELKVAFSDLLST